MVSQRQISGSAHVAATRMAAVMTALAAMDAAAAAAAAAMQAPL